mmetsp:Transcript_14206/g.27612  ORF Transcript_14206/g.27612 Transcript_14206/m.27612 type:complete len:359 (-) Transcript_14206:1190-2266(-)
MPANWIRLNVCANKGAKNTKASSVILVSPFFKDIVQAGGNKLKMRTKAIKSARLFLMFSNDKCAAGTELVRSDAIVSVLSDNDTVCISGGEDFVFADGRTTGRTEADRISAAISANVPHPPHWPWPAGAVKDIATSTDATPSDKTEPASTTTTLVDPSSVLGDHRTVAETEQKEGKILPPQSLEFQGPFPVLEGRVLELLREAVSGRGEECFSERDYGTYVSFDYHSVTSETFPIGNMKGRAAWMAAARRECRGLLVCKKTGQVLARRFHKFFNVEERQETGADAVTEAVEKAGGWGRVEFTNKLDGSLASPLLLPTSPVSSSSSTKETKAELVWATKNTVVEAIGDFVEQQGTRGAK